MKKLWFLIGFFLTHNTLAAFPTPVSATYYPIYNNGIGQYITPTHEMPFDKVSAIFIAFAHTYPKGNGAIFMLEDTQPDEINRLPLLVKVAHQVNPKIKLLISLGWEHNDWTYINSDYVNNANQFIPSVIHFIRKYNLDGFDIDDEGINGSSGYIPQENFDAVIKNLKIALDQAGKEDKKFYYLTITPAFGSANVNSNNINYFDLINTQNYGGSYPTDFTDMGYPAKQITQGINTDGCNTVLPASERYAGIFSWNMTSDSACRYYYTNKIADVVGYKPNRQIIFF
jgi:chitinase